MCTGPRPDIGQTVATDRDAGPQIEDHLAGIMAGAISPPVRQRGLQRVAEAGRVCGVDQQLGAREGHQPFPIAGHFHPAWTSVTVHLRSAFPFGSLLASTTSSFPYPAGASVRLQPVADERSPAW